MTPDAHCDDAHRDPVSPCVRMLWHNGLAHEEAIFGRLPAPVVDLRQESIDLGERETSLALASGAATILATVIRSGNEVGMPDLLRISDASKVTPDVKPGAALGVATGRSRREYLVQVAHHARIPGEIGVGFANTCAIVYGTGSTTTYDLPLPLGRNIGTGGDHDATLLTRSREVSDGTADTTPALSARDLQRRRPGACNAAGIAEVFATERCTDLYAIVAARTDGLLSSSGIKVIAKACGFVWKVKKLGGAASIEWFDRLAFGENGLCERIVAYDRDDVRAGAHLRAAPRGSETTGRIVDFRRPTS